MTAPDIAGEQDAPGVFRGLLGVVVERLNAAWGAHRKRHAEFVFTAGVIALAAKMAKADGVVIQAEIDAFLEICEAPPGEEAHVARLFNMAKESIDGYESYAAQLHRYFHDAPDTLEDVLEGLFHIAQADGALHRGEVDYLRTVATAFGIPDRFECLLGRYVGDIGADPHAVLGTSPDMSGGEVRKRYLALVSKYHPDALAARGVPESFLRIANDKMATINAAYAEIAAA